MNRENVIRMAREAGAAEFYPSAQSVKEQNYVVSAGFLERFAALVAAHERTRCARTAKAFKDHGYDYTGNLELHEAIAAGFDSEGA